MAVAKKTKQILLCKHIKQSEITLKWEWLLVFQSCSTNKKTGCYRSVCLALTEGVGETCNVAVLMRLGSTVMIVNSSVGGGGEASSLMAWLRTNNLAFTV